MKTSIVVNGDGMGRGDEALGRKILGTFLAKSPAIEGLDSILFYNAGVKLLADGSPVLQPLAALVDRGVDLIACATCVDHFELRERIRVGTIGSMDDIVRRMNASAKVITL